jgi:hypothetical protein
VRKAVEGFPQPHLGDGLDSARHESLAAENTAKIHFALQEQDFDPPA